MKRSGEVVQIGLDEADVFQPKLSAPTLGPDQRLLFVLYKDDLQEKKLLNNKITVKYHSNSKKYTQKETHAHSGDTRGNKHCCKQGLHAFRERISKLNVLKYEEMVNIIITKK